MVQIPPARFVFFAVVFIGATCVQAKPLSEGLQNATNCMVRVLIATPGVSDPRIDIDGQGDAPCVSFKPAEKNLWEGGFINFCLDKKTTSSKPYNFWGIVPGISDTYDNHVTEAVVKRWNKRCPVGVMVLSE